MAEATTAPVERDDYSGAFDPDFRYEDLSKPALVRLVREFAQIVHMLDRSMCAAIGLKYGAEAVKELAIEEWKGASPVYGERLRQIMNVEGDDVARVAATAKNAADDGSPGIVTSKPGHASAGGVTRTVVPTRVRPTPNAPSMRSV